MSWYLDGKLDALNEIMDMTNDVLAGKESEETEEEPEEKENEEES